MRDTSNFPTGRIWYDWTAVRHECEAKGLFWSDEFERHAQTVLAQAGITHPQADVIARLHLDYVTWLFTPQTYTWRQRLGLAWHFLFGKGFR